jgi:hypothetical protein
MRRTDFSLSIKTGAPDDQVLRKHGVCVTLGSLTIVRYNSKDTAFAVVFMRT